MGRLKKKPIPRETDKSKWSPAQIQARRTELLKRRDENDKAGLELNEKERVYKEQNKIEFFKPIGSKPGELPYQVQILGYLHDGKKVVTLVGGNGIGKTTLGAVITGSGCLCIQPWDKKDTIWGNRPIKARILCTDWEKHAATVVVPKLKEWLPLGEYTTSKNNLGIESVFTFKSGSTIEIVTGKQATADLEGWEGDLVWADEPFARDKFVALLRGLRRPPEKGGMGIFLITMTAVSEAWILDDIILNSHPSYASVTEIPQDANPYLTQEYKEVFRASLKEDEKVARIQGGWLNLVGLVWKFKSDIHLIDPFEIPTDWPIVPMIDWHTKLPIAVGFYAVDQRDFHYVIDEIWQNGSAEEIGDEIIRRKKLHSWRISEAFIDPLSKGDTSYIKNMGIDIVKDSFSRLKDKLAQDNIDLKVASKDKDSGIRNIENMLKGVNGMPSVFFFRNLNKIEKEGHIWEIQRWTYADDNKPKDENDHFMENFYRHSLVGMKYTVPLHNRGDLKSELDFDVFADNYGRRDRYAQI